MSLTYADFSNQTRSQKAVLVIHDANERIRFFTDVGSSTYKKVVRFFTSNVIVEGVSLTRASSNSLNSGEFFYQPSTKELFIRLFDDSTPETKLVVATYSFFWSNLPLILPYDLNNGEKVEFDSRVMDIGELKLELDYENTGIAIESSSSLTLNNNDGFFDEIFDTLIFENRKIRFYSYNAKLPITEAKIIFKGLIENKSFSTKEIKFAIKDEFYRLRELLSLPVFTSLDGSFDDALLNRPKRRLYGRFDRMKCESLSKKKDLFNLTGTISGAIGSNVIMGISTEFFKELSPSDVIKFTFNNKEYSFSIQDVTNDLTATISEELEEGFTDVSCQVETSVASKYYNRKFHIAGHKLCETITTITQLIDLTTIMISSDLDLFVDDLVEILGQTYTIKRKSENKILLNQALNPVPSLGEIIKKIPVYKAYKKNKELVYLRDYTIQNTGSDCNLIISDDAEKNITNSVLTTFNLNFTFGSNVITYTGGLVDLKTIFKSRDLIKVNNVSYFTYYEIFSVTESEIKLRTIFNESTITSNALYKSMEYIDDETLICVDCIGKADENNEWIKYPSQIVKDILNDSLIEFNQDSFDKSYYDAEYLMSVKVPKSIGDDSEEIRNIITRVNASVFGSLYFNSNFEFCYSVLNADKDEELKELKDDDILSFDVQTKNNIVNNVELTYKESTDLLDGEVYKEKIIFENEFVDSMVGINRTQKIETDLYYDWQAEIIAQRYAFFNSLTNSIVRVKAKLNLSLMNLNEPIFLNLDRLYKRFGGRDRRKIGIVNMVSKDESSVAINFNDLGGIFNRVCVIAPDSLDDIYTANDSDIVKYGFIVDNDNETPNNEEKYLGSNLIG